MEKYIMIIFFVLVSNQIRSQHFSYPEIYDSSLTSSLNILPNNILEVRNYITSILIFEMSFNGNNWKKFVIKNTQHLLINLYNKDKALIKICTSSEKGCKVYQIKGANRYRFFWNRKIGMWDLVKG